MREELDGLNVQGNLKKAGVDVATVDDLPVRVSHNRTTNYAAEGGDIILANTSAAAFTVTLPLGPILGDLVTFIDTGGSFNTNPLIVARNGKAIMGLAEDMSLDIQNVSVTFIYSNGDWRFF